MKKGIKIINAMLKKCECLHEIIEIDNKKTYCRFCSNSHFFPSFLNKKGLFAKTKGTEK